MFLTRLWKFEGSDTLDDCKDMVAELGGDLSKLPL